MKMKKAYFLGLMIVMFLVPSLAGAEEVGIITALKGTVIIQRGAEMISGQTKAKILLNDTISVMEFSRVKIKFTDDSVLTLYNNSKMNVNEYFYKDDGKKGRSIIKLIDGKLKSLVGKTEFEVHTATSVAAARGTHFFLSCALDGCLLAVFEGVVGFASKIEEMTKREVLVESGSFSRVEVVDGKIVNPSEPALMPNDMVKDLLSCKKEE